MRRRFRAVLLAGLVAFFVTPALAASTATYVIPHFAEVAGRVTNTTYTFDTDLFLTYTPGLAGTGGGAGASVQLYLYGQGGSPLVNAGNIVCNPCGYALDSGPNRKLTLNFENVITTATGPMNPTVQASFAIVKVSGDAEGVTLETDILNSHTSAFDMAMLTRPGQRVPAELPGTVPQVFVIPHFVEKSGVKGSATYTFDSYLHLIYTGGLAGLGGGGGATVDLYLFDSAGAPLESNNEVVCAPCSYAIGAGNRRGLAALEDVLAPHGPFNVITGWGVLVLGGDAGHVSTDLFVVNAHSSAFDVTLGGTPPQPLETTLTTSVIGEDRAGDVLALQPAPNPARGAMRFDITLGREGRARIEIFDLGGRRVASLDAGSRPAGKSEIAWDGRDDRGQPARAGLYYARLLGDDASRVSRFVVLQ